PSSAFTSPSISLLSACSLTALFSTRPPSFLAPLSVFPFPSFPHPPTQDPTHSEVTSAPPCPNAKLLPTCLIRNLTSLFLRHPALDFTLACPQPHHSLDLFPSLLPFHLSPLPPLALCPPSGPQDLRSLCCCCIMPQHQAPPHVPHPQSHLPLPPPFSRLHSRCRLPSPALPSPARPQDPKQSGAAAAAASCPNAKLLPTCLIRNLTSLFLRHPSLDFTLAAASPPLPALSVTSAFHPNRAPLLPHAAAWRAEHCGEGGSADIATPYYQRLLAELFLLADTPSLIFTHKSPAFSFVVARGSTRQSRGLQSSFRVVQPALCASACPKPLLENKFAQHMIVDESLKALYCALPKVGNTSWKLWFRLMKLRGNYSEFHSFNKTSSDNQAGSANGTAAADAGIGGTAAAEGTAAAPAAAAAASEPAGLNITTEDFKMIHLRGLNGLTELPDLHEEAAIRFITRRDVFRFTFVRNPLTRATSAFLDKFVLARNFTNEGDARLYWADAMFGKSKQLKKMLKSHPKGDFSFAEFLVLVEEALKGDADKIENHIDKQIDLCALDRVHYDFVGRFENMSADVAAVMRQLNTSDLGIFQKGKSLQLTGADQRSAQLYDKDSLERAHRIYSDDMSIPFNAIRYDIPEALKQVAAQENDTPTPAITTSRKL
ncbi:unnamed protein product, partial [Closterium sp. NIES-54]